MGRTRQSSDLEAEPYGSRLARLRGEKGLTQVELAERIGTIQAVVSDYERGKLRLNAEVIVQISKELGVPTDVLLDLDEPRRNRPTANRRLLRQLGALAKLSKRDQQTVARRLDGFLQGRLAS